MAIKQYRKFNNQVRDEILIAAINKFDRDRDAAVKKRPWMTFYGHETTLSVRKFHEKVYNELYSPTERARMKKLPEGWLPVRDHLRVHIKSMRNSGHDSVVLYFTKPHLVFHNHAFEVNVPTIEGPNARIIAEDNYLIEQWTNKRSELQRKIGVFMGACRTVEQLFERWPEVLALMPEGFFKPEPIGTQLVVQSSELNTILGL